jgi:hypothetical protein
MHLWNFNKSIIDQAKFVSNKTLDKERSIVVVTMAPSFFFF